MRCLCGVLVPVMGPGMFVSRMLFATLFSSLIRKGDAP